MKSKGGFLLRRWAIDLTEDPTGMLRRGSGAPESHEIVRELSNPPGWVEERVLEQARGSLSMEGGGKRTSEVVVTKEEKRERFKMLTKKSWELAFSPGRSLFIVGVMLFFTGSGTNIFSIMTMVSVLFMQLKTMSAVNATFRPITDAEKELTRFILLPKFVYLLLCAVGVGLAMYKGNKLGFLPTTESDWSKLLQIRHQLENVAVDITLKQF